MTVLTLKGNDAEDKEQGYAAYVNAIILSLEASKKYPDLKEPQHRKDVLNVKNEVVKFTQFKEIQRLRYSNYFENQREKLAGEINGPGTALKFDFAQQGNFTPLDGRNLHAYLKKVFSNLKINVRFTSGKPRCVVHVGL